MICKHCNADNPDNAEFCLNCGKELNLISCPYCGTENKKDVFYCQSCGKRLDGKLACPECGWELPENSEFCIMCGAKIKKVTPSAVVKETEISKKVSKIMQILSHSFAILIASLVMIFTVFMGLTYSGSNMGQFSGQMGKLNLFYFFGEAYKNLNESVHWVGWVMTILSSVICAVTLIVVVIIAIIAIVRSSKYLAGKDEEGGGIYMIRAFITYVIGVTLMMLVWNIKQNALGYVVAIKFDDVTTAGFAVCGSLVGLYFIFSVIGNGKKQLNKSFIINGSLCAVALIVSIITAAIFLMPALNFENTYEGQTLSAGFSQFNMILSLINSGMENELLIIIFMIASYLALSYAAIRAIGAIVTQIRDLIGGTSELRGSLGVSIEALVTSVIALAMAILAMNMIKDGEMIDENVTIGYGTIIGILVLSVISLGINIARKICINKFIE